MENYLFYWTFSNYATKPRDEMDAVAPAHLGLMPGWLTMQGKEKLVDKCFIAGNVVMQSHTGVSTYHTTIDSFTRQF